MMDCFLACTHTRKAVWESLQSSRILCTTSSRDICRHTSVSCQAGAFHAKPLPCYRVSGCSARTFLTGAAPFSFSPPFRRPMSLPKFSAPCVPRWQSKDAAERLRRQSDCGMVTDTHYPYCFQCQTCTRVHRQSARHNNIASSPARLSSRQRAQAHPGTVLLRHCLFLIARPLSMLSASGVLGATLDMPFGYRCSKRTILAAASYYQGEV